MRKQTNTLSPSTKGFQSPNFSDSDFREVRGLGLGRPKSSAKNGLSFLSSVFYQATLEDSQLSSNQPNVADSHRSAIDQCSDTSSSRRMWRVTCESFLLPCSASLLSYSLIEPVRLATLEQCFYFDSAQHWRR
jgi:hypothetical protein